VVFLCVDFDDSQSPGPVLAHEQSAHIRVLVVESNILEPQIYLSGTRERIRLEAAMCRLFSGCCPLFKNEDEHYFGMASMTLCGAIVRMILVIR